MNYSPFVLIGLFALALVAGCTEISAVPPANQSANQSNGTAQQAPSQSEILGSAEQQIDAEIIPDNSTGVEIGAMI
jgi:hypothetical protein